MDRCPVCNKYKNSWHNGMCEDCYEQQKKDRILTEGAKATHPRDFKNWDMGDMSELFWEHLGRMVKKPNQESLNILHLTFGWAGHADHGLCNSFYNAMKWANVLDYYIGYIDKETLPKTFEED